MSNIDISIIVPIYNVEKYLPKCIDSILNQTFKNFELILVNDGSPDRCGAICDRYAGLDSRIVVIHKENGGVSSARNAGLDLARGNYIGFVDPDDYIDADMYSTLFNLCENRGADIAVCKFAREINGEIHYNEEEKQIIELDNEHGMDELFKGVLYRFSLCNKLFKVHCFEGIQFPEGRIHEDLSTTYLLFSKATKIVYQGFKGYIYVRREESILTSCYNEKRLQTFVGWREIIEFIKQKYPLLINQVIACYSYFCLDHMTYILSQVNDKQKQIELLNAVRTYFKEEKYLILKSPILIIRHKINLILLDISPSAVIYIGDLKRRLR